MHHDDHLPASSDNTDTIRHIVAIGGGAAGIFFAINAAKLYPHCKVTVLEKTNQLLAKVRISGGGRCNVTHACFDPKKLVQNYPRGHKELLSPFMQFQPEHMIEWLEERGVILKTEPDGRIFPITDSSSTIIDTFLKEAQKNGVEICLQTKIVSIERREEKFFIQTEKDEIVCDKLLLASGSSSGGYHIAKSFGHTVVEPVPSLFTFNDPNSPLKDLSGISMQDVVITLGSFTQRGPLLITHFGFSGPSVLKLSAFAARFLHACDYTHEFSIDWIPQHSVDGILAFKTTSGGKNIGSENPFSLPRALWRRLLELSQMDPEKKLSAFSNRELLKFGEKLKKDSYRIQGKTTNKEEFVTCGGIHLSEINFKKMESKIVPNLFFAGEILDIDGITGGFNFQSAWTTAWIAAQHID